jgi:hypothetical protein
MLDLNLDLRSRLVRAGFAGIEAALRHSASELALHLVTSGGDQWYPGDDGARHYANYLAWADSVLVGIAAAMRPVSDTDVKERWDGLWTDAERQRMRKLRNDALKGRQVVVSWHTLAEMGESGRLLLPHFAGEEPALIHPQGHDVLGSSLDYWRWIRDTAIPILLDATQHGARPESDPNAPVPFPQFDPWNPFDAIQELDWHRYFESYAPDYDDAVAQESARSAHRAGQERRRRRYFGGEKTSE